MEDCVDQIKSPKGLLAGTPQRVCIWKFCFRYPRQASSVYSHGFWLKNAPATFQLVMTQILGDVDNCNAYVDDLVIFTDTWDSHFCGLDHVFVCLQRAILTLNLAKCEFGHATECHFGKQVGQGTVYSLDGAEIHCHLSNTKDELRRFLGTAGYYRNFSDAALTRTNFLHDSVPFVWSPSCLAAFNAAKLLLCRASVLSVPDFMKTFKLEVDMSSTGAGAVLIQEDAQGIDHPISFFSHKFNHE